MRHIEQTVSAEGGVFMHAGPLDREALARRIDHLRLPEPPEGT